MVREIEHSVAVITGGDSGIGRAAAQNLAARGSTVVLASHDVSGIEFAADEICERGYVADGITADVRDAGAVERLFDDVTARHGGLDILVNAAGVQRYGTIVETTEDIWDEVLDINLKGMYLTGRYAVPRMVERGGGAIVNVSSVQAFASQKGVAAYTASKGGINALTRAMALDHAEQGIRVNAVCPASVDTPMLRWAADRFRNGGSRDQLLESWGEMHPLGRLAQPDEIAAVIAFLVSPQASFVTGSSYPVDGGLLAALGVTLPD